MGLSTIVIIVTGPPGAGKTTLSQKIANHFKLPFFYRDGLKEELFTTLGIADREWSRKLGGAAYDLLFYNLIQLLKAGQSVVLESNFTDFNTKRLLEIQSVYHCKFIQVHIFAAPEILQQRFKERWQTGNRHPGHVDQNNMEVVTADILTRHPALQLGCPIIEIDTTDFSKIDESIIFSQINNYTN